MIVVGMAYCGPPVIFTCNLFRLGKGVSSTAMSAILFLHYSICVATVFGSKSSDDADKVLSWFVVSSRQVKPMTLEVFLSYTSLFLILTSSNTKQMYFCQSSKGFSP